jgi:Zn-dependent protease
MISVIIKIIVVVFSVILHELAHAYSAYYFGDDTAKKQGRLSFNPLKHLELTGSVIVPMFLIIMKSPILFAWAKPVPIDMAKMRNAKKNIALVSFAGPLVNILLVIIAVIVLNVIKLYVQTKYNVNIFVTYSTEEAIATNNFLRNAPFYTMISFAMYHLAIINTILAIFNLIPIPPLDGSKLFYPLLNSEQEVVFAKIERYGFLIIILLLYFNILNPIFAFSIHFVKLLIIK